MADPIDVRQPGDDSPIKTLVLDERYPVTKDDLPALMGDPGWRSFRKTSLTQAVRVTGPFKVQTSESPGNAPFECADGWLAVDARGYPYAIADDEFRRIYEEAKDVTANDAVAELLNTLDAAVHQAQLLGPTRETSIVKTKIDEALLWLLDAKERGIPTNSAHPGQAVAGRVVRPPRTGGPHA